MPPQWTWSPRACARPCRRSDKLELAFEETHRVERNRSPDIRRRTFTAKSHTDLREAAVVKAVLSRQLDDLEPSPKPVRFRRRRVQTRPEILIRHRCDVRSVERRQRNRKATCAGSSDIPDEFRVKPADVRLFPQVSPPPARTCELAEPMLVAGLSV